MPQTQLWSNCPQENTNSSKTVVSGVHLYLKIQQFLCYSYKTFSFYPGSEQMTTRGMDSRLKPYNFITQFLTPVQITGREVLLNSQSAVTSINYILSGEFFWSQSRSQLESSCSYITENISQNNSQRNVNLSN